MKFIGRATELKRLNSFLSQKEQANALIFGRRRIGKSELIKQALQSNERVIPIYFECRQTSEQDNMQSLAALASEALGFPPLAFNNFREFLDFLFIQSRDKTIVLALDEYPYLRDSATGVDSILQTEIDRNRDDSSLKIILCGSYVEVMKSLVEASNPLYGRIDFALELGPMDYLESARFYPDYSPEDKIRIYSVFGGIPYYNRLVDQSKTVSHNIIDLVTEPGARLENEVPQYLGTEISKIANANEVFGALAQGFSKWKDLLAQSHVSSGPSMTDVLAKLMQLGLVQKQAPINDPQNKRKTGYRIIDPLTLFFYRYVFRYASQRQLLDPEVFYRRFVDDSFENNHVPHMFEEICRQYLVRQNRSGHIDPAFDAIGKYWYDDPERHASGEFDVVTHDPQGYAFYEAKFRTTPITQKMIEQEIEQVRATGLNCHRYGFFSRSGFDTAPIEGTVLIGIEDMFEN